MKTQELKQEILTLNNTHANYNLALCFRDIGTTVYSDLLTYLHKNVNLLKLRDPHLL